MNRPLIIGEAPGKHGDPSAPCEGRVGRRLADCAGISFEEYMTLFDRLNLLDEQPQDAPKGMTFNVKKAGRKARQIELEMPRRSFILLLGKRVAAAFRFTKVAYFQQIAIDGIPTYVVPHPSGVNRWWNDYDNELAIRQFMHRIVMEVKSSKAGAA